MKPSEVRRSGYRLIDHTADVGFLIFGPTQKTLFEAAARALSEILVEGESTRALYTKTLRIEGQDRAELMVNWLRECLYLWAGKALLVKEVEVTEVSARRLFARIRVEPYDPKRHTIKTDIKAVTYHQARVERAKDGWEARVIFDV